MPGGLGAVLGSLAWRGARPPSCRLPASRGLRGVVGTIREITLPMCAGGLAASISTARCAQGLRPRSWLLVVVPSRSGDDGEDDASSCGRPIEREVGGDSGIEWRASLRWSLQQRHSRVPFDERPASAWCLSEVGA